MKEERMKEFMEKIKQIRNENKKDKEAMRKELSKEWKKMMEEIIAARKMPEEKIDEHKTPEE